jgi:hypothetical protein
MNTSTTDQARLVIVGAGDRRPYADLTGKPEVSGDLRSDGPLVRA